MLVLLLMSLVCVNIRCPMSGSLLSLEVDPSLTIHHVINLLTEQYGVRNDLMRLTLRGRQIRSECSLTDLLAVVWLTALKNLLLLPFDSLTPQTMAPNTATPPRAGPPCSSHYYQFLHRYLNHYHFIPDYTSLQIPHKPTKFVPSNHLGQHIRR